MKNLKSLSLFAFVLFFSSALGAVSQSSQDLDLDSQSNSTNATVPPAVFNGTLGDDIHRYLVPGSPIVLDFFVYARMPSIIRTHALMTVVEGLSQICGKSPTDTIPQLNTFKYKNYAFVHIQDLNPTVGREHTYADMAATLRGVAQFMIEYDEFRAMEFQIWSSTPGGITKIGSGAIGGAMRGYGVSEEGDASTSSDASDSSE